MPHVFITYSRSDQDYARQLANHLRANELEIWFEENGATFDDVRSASALEALRTCAAFVLVMSPQAKESRWVQAEMALAEDLCKPILPVLRSGKNWSHVPDNQVVAASEGELPGETFLERLKTLVSSEVSAMADAAKGPGVFLPSEFLSTLSRRLRTPLNGVIGFSRVLLDGMDGPLNDIQQKDLNAIYESGLRLLGLITDLFDMVRLQSGPVELSADQFDLQDVIRSVMSQTVRLTEGKPVHLETEAAPNLPPALGDSLRTRQALLNIVSIVCESTFEGNITVSAAPLTENERSWVRVSVASTSMTINDGDLSRLFEAFQLSEKHNLGLRLPLAKALIELQGGAVAAESTPENGTTFALTLPAGV